MRKSKSRAHKAEAAPGAEAPKIFSETYYARLHSVERSHWYTAGMRAVARALLDAHGFSPTGRILDAGCGTGGTLEWLRAQFPQAQVIGLDLASDALGYVKRSGAFCVLQASVAQLPFRSSTFDLVLSFDVLQHVPEETGEAATTLSEAARVLRPGGALLIRAAARRWGDTPGARWPDGYHRYRVHELSEEVRAVGLSVLRATPANCLGSLLDDARQWLRPSRSGHGTDPGLAIRPTRHPRFAVIQRLVMRCEALYVRRLRARLPWGHALLVLATKERVARPGTV